MSLALIEAHELVTHVALHDRCDRWDIDSYIVTVRTVVAGTPTDVPGFLLLMAGREFEARYCVGSSVLVIVTFGDEAEFLQLLDTWIVMCKTDTAVDLREQ